MCGRAPDGVPAPGEGAGDSTTGSAKTSGIPELHGSANSLARDIDAVRTGLTLPWSSGVIEGRVNRIKMLKRQMFGRAAGHRLLRHRILLAH
ncbi:hypothetical protein [Streptomyces lasiicapitis]|uniref:hypothetical protein n=1 Tax=Streptomyces lasiicapitis TaxID=1923961 RepID=UPI003667A1B8